MSDTPKNPWDDKVASAFDDPEVQAKVSEFLGKEIQPYVTQLEQNTKPNRDATRLWEALETAPVETSIQVVKEMFGDEIGESFATILQGGDPTAEVETPEETPAEEGEEESQKVKFEDLPPEVQNAIAAQQQEEQKKAYYSEIDRVKEEHADRLPKTGEGDDAEVVLDVDLFHPFVVAANGDFDQAIEAYASWQDKAKETFGIQVPESASAEGESTDPPPVIDSTTRDASATPPTEKTYDSLDDAIDDFFADQKNPPPTVGTA